LSSLWLVRHGQASFGADDYDALSERGIAQSRALGRSLAQLGRPFDALYSGPRQRQIDTARHLVDESRAAGIAQPEITRLQELDEYPFEVLLKRSLPHLLSHDAELRAFVERGGFSGGDPREVDRHFRTAFEFVMQRWSRGELEAAGAESFAAFQARVRRGLEHIMETEGRGRTVVVVTSGGPISITLQLALGLADAMALKMGLVIANASVTEIKYTEHEVSLTGFNSIAHLPRELVTYR